MLKLPEEFEDLTPGQARYRLAETKLRLLNALAQLELMERDLLRKSGDKRSNDATQLNSSFKEAQSSGSSNSTPARR